MNKQLRVQLQHFVEGMLNSGNEDFFYQKEKLEEAIKIKYRLALLLEQKQATCAGNNDNTETGRGSVLRLILAF